jgi:CDP-diacylglycerol--glycerol-3-phosphate 3-phosphatidyltransferase
MLSRWIRTWYGGVLQPLLSLMDRLGITANMLTLASLFVVVMAAILLGSHRMIWGAWFLLFGGFLDGMDGALARHTNIQSPLGGFLDSICDHLGDFAVSLGLLLPSLQRGDSLNVSLIFFALFFSVFGSHVRSRAGMLGMNTRSIGIFTRCERIFILVAGLLIQQITLTLCILVIFNSFSALQRLIYTIRLARDPNAGKNLIYHKST